MQIHVARDSAQLGVFSPEEITGGLLSGRFRSSDLAWREGMDAWTPLGEWAEFRAVAAPPSPGAASSVPSASTIPWEQGKSFGSFFRTIKVAVTDPSGLGSGRYAFGDWLVFCYFGLLISLPFQLVRMVIVGDPNAQLGNFLKDLPYPQVQSFADQMLKTPPPPLWINVAGGLGGLAFAPLIYAFCALPHWLGQRLFRLPVSLERTVAATLLATAVLIVLMAPLQLLAFSMALQLAIGAVFFIPVCVIYFRAFGGATGVNAWAQFGISCFVWFILFCCCCFLPALVLFGSFAKAFAR